MLDNCHHISNSTCLLQAKESLLRVIDDYINEKIVLADEAISQSCLKIINDGDVILVHAQYVVYQCLTLPLIRFSLSLICSSSIVQKCLVDAHVAGKDFRVIVVDSRPKMEGLQCAYGCQVIIM